MTESGTPDGPTSSAGRRERWRAAVLQGAVGYAARADTGLEALAADAARAGDTPIESLCRSTRASLLRQAGGHDKALILDARALSVIGLPTGEGATDDGWAYAARLDALVGLAADNLGRFAFGASMRLLGRARTLAGPVTDPATDREAGGSEAADWEAMDWECGVRPRLRCEWVSAELDLYRGDPAAARTHAQAGLGLLETLPADRYTRHRVKTELIAAAVDAAAGRTDAAIERGQRCRQITAASGLLPLEWAATALLGGLVSDPGIAADNQRLQAELTRRGMSFGR
ncbi:hypothetical protein [Gordonia amarae]|uniref:hypothetical protein n=1 Tax=Gordonia amarae TaxID=36821 RepID=UPI001BCBBAF6|nr:hypothetical protein [Gordonia amarae]